MPTDFLDPALRVSQVDADKQSSVTAACIYANEVPITSLFFIIFKRDAC
jgi:hypothetical protein